MSRTILRLIALLIILPGCDQYGPLEGSGEQGDWSVKTAIKPRRVKIVTWNVQSSDSKREVIANQLTRLRGVDIFLLTEFGAANVYPFLRALNSIDGRNYEAIGGGYGGDSNQILVYYDKSRIRLRVNHALRYPVVDRNIEPFPWFARFQEKASKIEFQVVGVHFNQDDSELRLRQAKALGAWLEQQQIPTIIGGTTFSQVSTDAKNSSPTHQALIDGGMEFIWPQTPLDTWWQDLNRDNEDDHSNAISDGFFVNAPVLNWNLTCEVLLRKDDFPDSDRTSNHRPVSLHIGNLIK